MSRFIHYLAGAFLAAASSAVAQDPAVTVRLTTGVVRLGEQAVLELTVTNASRVRILETPEVDGLEIGRPSGPSRSEYTQVFGGRRRHYVEVTYRLALRGTREGTFELPPIPVEADGQRLETKPLRLKVLVDLKGSEVGFLEVRTPTARVVEGQPFTVDITFGWDASSSFNYASLSLPWWDSLRGTIRLDPEKPPRDGRVVVNDEVEVAVERVGDPERTVWRLRRSYLPTRSGTLEFGTSFLEFGRVSSQSVFGGQQKVANFFVQSDPFSIEVVPLPSEGQPLDFTGAVGTLAASASADTRDVRVGDSIKLSVDWTGAGNLEFFEPPKLDALDAFRAFQLYGKTEEKSFARRRVVYDVAPLSADVGEIPPVPLWVYDPERDEYVELRTEPIPIRVRPLENAIALETGEPVAYEDDVRDIDARPIAGRVAGNERSDASANRALIATAAALPVLWLALRLFVRRSGDPNAPLERRRRRAPRALAKALQQENDTDELLIAFTRYLAARAREPDEAWTGRDPLDWDGAPPAASAREALEQASELTSRLERAVYGGGRPVKSQEVLDVARRLERVGI